MATGYGYRTSGFPGWTFAASVAEMARLGYDCVEVCLEEADTRPESLTETACRALRRTLDGAGLALAAVSYHGDREPVVERAQNQRRAIDIAHWLRVDTLVLNGEWAGDRKRQWDEHVVRFTDLARLAGEAGVTIALEPQPELIAASSQEGADLLRLVGSPHLKLNLDIGHARVTDDDPAATVHALGREIVYLHLEDIKDRIHRHLPFGEGEIDFAAIRQALGEIGYAGPYVVDLIVPNRDPAEVAAQALKAMRTLFPRS